jgi:hypothetical protein
LASWALGFFVLVLAEVHQAAHRRLGHRRDLHEINAGFFRRFRAARRETMPTCSPSSPVRRTSGALISPLMRSFLS